VKVTLPADWLKGRGGERTRRFWLNAPAICWMLVAFRLPARLIVPLLARPVPLKSDGAPCGDGQARVEELLKPLLGGEIIVEVDHARWRS